MPVKYYFDFSEKDKEYWSRKVPRDLQENRYLQRMFKTDPKGFKKLNEVVE